MAAAFNIKSLWKLNINERKKKVNKLNLFCDSFSGLGIIIIIIILC